MNAVAWGHDASMMTANYDAATRAREPFSVFPAGSLAAEGPAVLAELKRIGFICVSGVPGLAGAYDQLLEAARRFVALPASELAECAADDPDYRGWSRGRSRNGGLKRDTYLGSLYAAVPDTPMNLWPAQVPELRPAFLAVGEIVSRAAAELLPIVGLREKTSSLGRLLHYRAIPPGEDDGNPYWCGRHRDGWLLTGLCAEAFYRDGAPCERPYGFGGLYIDGVAVSVPRDALIFQVGASLEYRSGQVFASDHWVCKAPPGVERFAFAVFINYSYDAADADDADAGVEKE